MTTDPKTEAAAVAELATAAEINTALLEVGLAAVPSGFKLQDLDAYQDAPRRAKSSPTFVDADSLVAYLNRFGGPDAVAFADEDGLRIRAVLDYHDQADDKGVLAPHHGDHTATLALKASPEWLAFQGAHRSPMPQRQFAEFVETHLHCVASPAGAEVLEAVKSIEAVRNVEFASKVDLDRGDLAFKFTSETRGTGHVHFPERVTLALPPFVGSAAVEVQARTRYRIGDDGSLMLWIDLLNAEEASREAWDLVCAKVEAGAGLDGRLFQGKA